MSLHTGRKLLLLCFMVPSVFFRWIRGLFALPVIGRTQCVGGEVKIRCSTWWAGMLLCMCNWEPTFPRGTAPPNISRARFNPACAVFSYRECTRGGFCNFMHLKPISRELRRELYGRRRKRYPNLEVFLLGINENLWINLFFFVSPIRHRSRSRSRERRSRSRDRRRDRERPRRSRDRERSGRFWKKPKTDPMSYQIPSPLNPSSDDKVIFFFGELLEVFFFYSLFLRQACVAFSIKQICNSALAPLVYTVYEHEMFFLWKRDLFISGKWWFLVDSMHAATVETWKQKFLIKSLAKMCQNIKSPVTLLYFQM